MEQKQCPYCGGKMNMTIIGWMCPFCRTHVDMRGKVHIHKEEPLAPHSTKKITCEKCQGRGFVTVFHRDGNGISSITCGECKGKGYTVTYKTNADCIRAMSDEQLAKLLCGTFDTEIGAKFICGTVIPEYDEDAIREWLQQPAEEENDG